MERLYLKDDPDFGVVATTNARAIYRHKQRYETCGLLYRGKVLHLGCGSGYGRDIIARNPMVKEVWSVDRDTNAVEYAKKYHGTFPGAVLDGDVTSAENMDVVRTMGPWDTIVMIELFEHLTKQDQDTLIDRCLGMLAPGGKLIISTPTGDGLNPDNPYHLHERTEEAVMDLANDLGAQVFDMGAQLMTDGHPHTIMFVVAG